MENLKITREKIEDTLEKVVNKDIDKIYTFYEDIIGLYSSFIEPQTIVDIPFDHNILEKFTDDSNIRKEFALIDLIIADKYIFSMEEMNTLFKLFKMIQEEDIPCSNEEIEILSKILIRDIPCTFEHILYLIVRYNTEFGGIKEIWNTPVRNNINIHNLRTNILSHDIYGYEIVHSLKTGESIVFCDIEENFIETSELVSIFKKNPNIDLLDFIISITGILTLEKEDVNRIKTIIKENDLVMKFNNTEMEENYLNIFAC